MLPSSLLLRLTLLSSLWPSKELPIQPGRGGDRGQRNGKDVNSQMMLLAFSIYRQKSFSFLHSHFSSGLLAFLKKLRVLKALQKLLVLAEDRRKLLFFRQFFSGEVKILVQVFQIPKQSLAFESSFHSIPFHSSICTLLVFQPILAPSYFAVSNSVNFS